MKVLFFLIVSLQIYSQTESFTEKSLTTKKIAEKYIQNYFELKFDELSKYHTKESIWHDPTAEELWGTKAQKGKEQIYKHFKDVYKNSVYMKATVKRSFFSGSFAIFETDLDYAIKVNGKSKVIKKLPVNFHLRIKNGKVLEHLDFADYTVFISEYNKK